MTSNIQTTPPEGAEHPPKVCPHCGCAIKFCGAHNKFCCVQHCKGYELMGYRNDNTVKLEGRLEAQSGKAKLVVWTNSGEQSWVPKSQIKSEEVIDGDGNTMFEVTEWFAKKEGLI